MMNRLMEAAEQAVRDEVARVEVQHGRDFASMHEAYAVILEEIQEARDALNCAEIELEFMWDDVKTDDAGMALTNAEHILHDMKKTACEAIQTAAVALKAMRTCERIREENKQ